MRWPTSDDSSELDAENSSDEHTQADEDNPFSGAGRRRENRSGNSSGFPDHHDDLDSFEHGEGSEVAPTTERNGSSESQQEGTASASNEEEESTVETPVHPDANRVTGALGGENETSSGTSAGTSSDTGRRDTTDTSNGQPDHSTGQQPRRPRQSTRSPPAPTAGTTAPPREQNQSGSSADGTTPSPFTRLKKLVFDDGPSYDTYRWTEADHEAFQQALISDVLTEGGPLLKIRPARNNPGMDRFESILRWMHETRVRWKKNVSPAHSFEIWSDNGAIVFHIRTPSTGKAEDLTSQLKSAYPNTSVEEVVTSGDHPEALYPLLEPGNYVAAAKFSLKRSFAFPIRSQLDEEKDPFEDDPYRAVLADMTIGSRETTDGTRVKADDVRILVQVILQPARDSWAKGGLYGINLENIAHRAQEKQLYEYSRAGGLKKEYELGKPTNKKKQAARIIGSVSGMDAFHMAIRIVAISPYEEFARSRAKAVARDMETYYNSFTEQGLQAHPMEADAIPTLVTQSASRSHGFGRLSRVKYGNKLVQPLTAVAGIAHLPNAGIEVPNIEWATQDVGAGVPPGTPQGEDELAAFRRDDEDEDDGFVTFGAE